MGSSLRNDDILHRSRIRIRNLGEVFTPDACVESMLDLLAKDNRTIWKDTNISFFEPTCGHGNIVCAIVNRRLNSIYKQAVKYKIKYPDLYAVANTLNTLWAIDIDKENVEHTRERVLRLLFSFILEKRQSTSIYQLIEKHFDYFAHLLCAIKWHIHENEALSAISNIDNAEQQASLTKTGQQWFKNNGHQPLEFDLSWTDYFRDCDENNLAPIDFERSQQFIVNILEGYSRGQNHFLFTKNILLPLTRKAKYITSKQVHDLGA